MILIDNVEMDQESLEEMFFGVIPFRKIGKRPEFQINNKRKSKKPGQDQQISSPVGTRVPAHFMAKWQGKTITIRYAEYSQEEPLVPGSDRIVTKYHPFKVMFTGVSMLTELNELGIDLAIFFFLHPLNEFSPFRDQLKEKFHWSFNDTQAKAAAELKGVKLLQKAINTVLALSDDALNILAKGIGFPGVAEMEPETIQAMLVRRAQADPQAFLEESQSQRTGIKGLIISAIDNGLFKEEEANGKRKYVWGRGDKKGIQVVEILENGKAPSEILTDHIFNMIDVYYPILTDSYNHIATEKSSDQFLDSKGSFDYNSLGSIGKKEQTRNSEFGGSTDESIMERELQLNSSDNLNQDAEFVKQAVAEAGLVMPEKSVEEVDNDLLGEDEPIISDDDDPDFAFLRDDVVPAPKKKVTAKKS